MTTVGVGRKLQLVLLGAAGAIGVLAPPAEAVSVATLTSNAPQTALVGRAFNASATVTSPENPTGAVTFKLYGNGDDQCAFPAIITQVAQLVDGVATITGIVLNSTATHKWVMSYGGDANHPAVVTSPCGGSGRLTTVYDPIIATLKLTATQTAVLGSPISSTATLEESNKPGGSITFYAYPPGDPNCAGVPEFTKQVAVDSDATAKSGNFIPAVTGTYRWRAYFSGDQYHWEVNGTCAEGASTSVTAAEALGVPKVTVIGATSAKLGETVIARAEITDGKDPTGVLTFQAFGPDDPTCGGQPVASSTGPLDGNFEATSQPFTATQAGEYRWKATYGGDAKNIAASSGCGGFRGVSVITGAGTGTTPDPAATPTPSSGSGTPSPGIGQSPVLGFPDLPAALQLLACAKTRVVLVDVVRSGRRVRITGVATPSGFAGKTAQVLLGTKVVGSAVVAATGDLATTVPLPPAGRRPRYQLRIGTETSSRVYLDRRSLVDSITVTGGMVVIKGRITRPFPKSPAKVTFRRQTSCTTYADARSVKPDRKGRFTARLPLPAAPATAAVYRGETKVATRRGGKAATRSYTLARAVTVR